MLKLQDDGVTVRCESNSTFSKTKTCKSTYLGMATKQWDLHIGVGPIFMESRGIYKDKCFNYDQMVVRREGKTLLNLAALHLCKHTM